MFKARPDRAELDSTAGIRLNGALARRRAVPRKKLLTEVKRGLLLPLLFAGVAQLVEHFLAKEDVESSSLFARSILR